MALFQQPASKGVESSLLLVVAMLAEFEGQDV